MKITNHTQLFEGACLKDDNDFFWEVIKFDEIDVTIVAISKDQKRENIGKVNDVFTTKNNGEITVTKDVQDIIERGWEIVETDLA